MIPALTSSYRDWGFVALGFSAGALIEIGLALLSDQRIGGDVLARLVCAGFVGPMVVWSLLLEPRIPHRIVLAMGALALVAYVGLHFR